MVKAKNAILGACLMASSVVAIAGSATADVVTMTYSGTVSSVTGNTDSLNLFGGGNLAGDSFTTVFKFDTSKGTLTGDAGGQTLTSGGSSDGAFFPTVFTITNNGKSYSESLTQSTFDSATKAATGGDGVNDSLQNGTTQGIGAGTNFGIGSSISATPVAPASFTTDNTFTNNCFGCISFGSFTVGGEDIEFAPVQEVTFDTTTGMTAAVPEPSTWAMLLLGFCGLGFMTYRRRNQGAALAA